MIQTIFYLQIVILLDQVADLVEAIRLREVVVIRLQEVEVEVEVQAEVGMGVEGIETCRQSSIDSKFHLCFQNQ
ncbi:hypothetical protein [Leptospira mtsangambouensis]|uniref:hypothetical protein n=1 Tax=Leptospira mtsangambouensis TaxID=2484912 RepID=UPI001ABF743A|nr:hypothetical protein [Leptospira mtsangambouensis]